MLGVLITVFGAKPITNLEILRVLNATTLNISRNIAPQAPVPLLVNGISCLLVVKNMTKI